MEREQHVKSSCSFSAWQRRNEDDEGVRTGIDFRHLITAVFAHLHPNRKLVSSYCGSFWKRPGRSTAPKHEKRIAVYNLYRYMGCAEVRPRWSCQCFSIRQCTNTNALSSPELRSVEPNLPVKCHAIFIFEPILVDLPRSSSPPKIAI